MKTEHALQRSADAALNKAVQLAFDIRCVLEVLRDERGLPAKEMPFLRKAVAELTQRVHEYNAYTNALKT